MSNQTDTMEEAVARLRARLVGRHLPFEYIETTPDGARIRFIGPWQGQEVIWDARVHRLPPTVPRYIEVGARGTDAIALSVGLDVALIDEATLHKTVIMIRRWKRLAPGRHSFGLPPE